MLVPLVEELSKPLVLGPSLHVVRQSTAEVDGVKVSVVQHAVNAVTDLGSDTGHKSLKW